MPSLDSKKGKLRPGYFIVRKGAGEIVPLIAVDELPRGVDIVNVPRYLALQEAFGMLNLGIVPRTDACYEIAMSEDFYNMISENENARKLKNPAVQHLSPTSPKTLHQASAASVTIPPSTLLGSSPHVKSPHSAANPQVLCKEPGQICRHWCHHGICKWGQQCRYRHTMPMALLGLQKVGLEDWPEWYRALNPGYFASEAIRTVRASRTRPVRVKYDYHCVGKGKMEKAIVKGTSASKFVVKEKESGRVLRKEEVGEQIIKRLREMSGREEGKEKDREKVLAGGMVERAVGGGTRRWEEESEDGDEETESDEVGLKKGVVQKQGMLVDV